MPSRKFSANPGFVFADLPFLDRFAARRGLPARQVHCALRPRTGFSRCETCSECDGRHSAESSSVFTLRSCKRGEGFPNQGCVIGRGSMALEPATDAPRRAATLFGLSLVSKTLHPASGMAGRVGVRTRRASLRLQLRRPRHRLRLCRLRRYCSRGRLRNAARFAERILTPSARPSRTISIGTSTPASPIPQTLR